MAFITTIPTELQRLCIQHLVHDTATLKSLRLVSHHFCTLATDYLFHTAILKFNADSVPKFDNVLSHDPFRSCVRKVIVNAEEGSDEAEYDWENDEVIGTRWGPAIEKLVEFQGLKSVELRFDGEAGVDEDRWQGKQSYDYRMRYMKEVFKGLRGVEGLEGLTICRFQDATCACVGRKGKQQSRKEEEEVDGSRQGDYPTCGEEECLCRDENLLALRPKIRNLHVLIATEYDSASPENNIEMEALHDCFTLGLKNLWLLPMQTQLVNLSLYSESYWGVWPLTDLRGIHFPNLKSLALGNFTIGHQWQIDWITFHGSTLQELILDDCPIVYAMNGIPDIMDANWPDMRPSGPRGWGSLDWNIIRLIPLRWHTIFPLFTRHLVKLRHFGMGHGRWQDDIMFDYRYELPALLENTRYVSYYHGQGPSQWNEGDLTRYVAEGQKRRLKWDNEHGVETEVHVPSCDKEDEEAFNGFLDGIGVDEVRREDMTWLSWDDERKMWAED